MALTRKRAAIAALVIVPLGLILLVASTQVCLSAWLRHGVALDRCPSGGLRQTVEVTASGLTRGGKGTVSVRAVAHYTLGSADHALSESLGRFEPSVFLVEGEKETLLRPLERWSWNGHEKSTRVELPKLSDGEYVLRAKVKSSLGEASHDLPLPLFAPARVHVITDRPLYEPGNTVRFRAVVLRARDLAPLQGRPGLWIVEDPTGEVLLEERAPAGDWGVVAGSFPLDRGAATGDWTLRWSSGGASDAVTFRVQPFTLPRFRIDLAPGKPFYGRHERPTLRGKVLYSSGAPVTNASLSFSWSAHGDWPPPTHWLSGGLPQSAVTGPGGRFSLELPEVPEDLRGQATLSARVAAVDPAGDRVEGAASVLLSADPIQVSTITELADGLVEGFNNRVYLRATTADGRVIEGAHLTVKRAWEPRDPGVNAPVDEDGVASLQLDPGPPVNVVIPPAPFRPPPKAKAVTRGEVRELLSPGEPPLADQVAMEAWEKLLEPCAQWASAETEPLTIGVRVSASGAIVAAAPPDTRLGRCVASKLSARSLPPGRDRLYAVELAFDASDLPSLEASLEGVPSVPERLEAELSDAVQGLRDCIPPSAPSAALPRAIEWRLRAGSKEVTIGWVPDPRGEPFPPAALTCMEARLDRLTLSEPLALDALGLARLRIEAPEKYEAMRPQPTVMVGYELLVTARRGDQVLGDTRVVLGPGSVPPVRMRASPVVANPGERVEVEILRGPNFTGELPEKLFVYHGRTSLEAKVDEKTRTARFEVPEDADGWLEASWSGARALVFVRPRAQLALEVRPDKQAYAPGELARLSVETTSGGKGAPAAVGLFGVDETLEQLVPLPGADAMARVRPELAARQVLGALDAQALAMGRIRGANAAAAVILGVASVPRPDELDAAVHASSQGAFDPVLELTDRFYTALAELHAQTRAWEASAPAGERMTPKAMAALWEKALDACQRRKEPVTDAFGRRLRLSRLPPDLLALTAPHAVVVAGTRLPEDVENWSQFVAREAP